MNKKNIFLWTLYDFANSIVMIVFFLYFSQWLVIEKNVPLFVAGDMNTSNRDTSGYNDMLNIMNVEDGILEGGVSGSYNIIKNDLKEKKSSAMQDSEVQSVKIIDYILFQPNGIQPKSFIREVKIFQYPWDEKHKDLSDHYAVYAKIVF